jgi:hypothetical protein
MAWLYEKSATWRKIVAFTRQGPLYMATFAGLAVAVPYLAGDLIMNRTNPNEVR